MTGSFELVSGNRAAALVLELGSLEQGASRAETESIFNRISYLEKDLRFCLDSQEPVFMYISRRKDLRIAKDNGLLRLDPGPDGHVFMQLMSCEGIRRAPVL